jgi:hypothetical protein
MILLPEDGICDSVPRLDPAKVKRESECDGQAVEIQSSSFHNLTCGCKSQTP